jgi:hypothetical protein
VRIFTLLLALVLGSGGAFAFDCAGVKLPSSLVICSDPELMGLADERQAAFDQAVARLDAQQQKELLADQTGWVRSYATACGAPPDRTPPNPVPDAVRGCFKRAAQARIAYIRAYGLVGGASPPSAPSTASKLLRTVTPMKLTHVTCYASQEMQETSCYVTTRY